MFEGQTLNWQIIDWEGQTVLMVFCGDFAQKGGGPGIHRGNKAYPKKRAQKKINFRNFRCSNGAEGEGKAEGDNFGCAG